MIAGIEFGKLDKVIFADIIIIIAEILNLRSGLAFVIEDNGSPPSKSITALHS